MAAIAKLLTLISILFICSCGGGSDKGEEVAQKAQIFQTLLAGLRFDGADLAGGKVYFYSPGTTTFKSIYIDRDKTTEAANPYTLDANGQASIYGDGVYDIKVDNASNVEKAYWYNVSIADVSAIFTTLDADGFSDKITDIGATPTTLFISVDQTITSPVNVPATIDLVFLNGAKFNISGSGAVTGLKTASILDFGASTAAADNSAAFNNAFIAVGEGGKVFVPNGEWDITATVTTSAAYQTLEGESWKAIINQTSTLAGKGGISTAYDGLNVRNIQIKSPLQVGNENIAIAAMKDDLSAISDITAERCYLNNFSYGVSITNATRPTIKNNYIYSTGDNSTDTGGALQISEMVDGIISDNVIDGDPSNKFQHGMYLAGDIDGAVIEGNTIRDGFYSYGIHIYGSTFTNGRKNIVIANNMILNITNGILLGRSTDNIGDVQDVRVIGNIVKVSSRAVYFEANILNNILVQGNHFESGGSATAPSVIFEIKQSTGEELNGFQVIQNTFKNFKTGGLDINNAISMSGLTIDSNTFIPDNSGLSALTMDAPTATGYTALQITNNKSSGAYSVIISSTNYSGWRNVSWLTMYGNSWDIGLHEKVTRVTTTPYTLLDTDQVLWVTTGASAITINLPTIVGHLDGRKVTVCKIDSGVGTVIIDPDSTQLINGASTYILTNRWQTVVFQAIDGSAWVIVGTN